MLCQNEDHHAVAILKLAIENDFLYKIRMKDDIFT